MDFFYDSLKNETISSYRLPEYDPETPQTDMGNIILDKEVRDPVCPSS